MFQVIGSNGTQEINSLGVDISPESEVLYNCTFNDNETSPPTIQIPSSGGLSKPNTKEESTNTIPNKYQCCRCNKVCKDANQLKIHLRYHSGGFNNACNSCELGFISAAGYTTHMRRIHNMKNLDCYKQKYSCTQCNKEFKDSDMLKLHARYHSGDYEYLCNYCQIGYNGQKAYYFKLHMEHEHNETVDTESKYICTQCIPTCFSIPESQCCKQRLA